VRVPCEEIDHPFDQPLPVRRVGEAVLRCGVEEELGRGTGVRELVRTGHRNHLVLLAVDDPPPAGDQTGGRDDVVALRVGEELGPDPYAGRNLDPLAGFVVA
jgi:hypothetical protein